jgi:hypothetical protein
MTTEFHKNLLGAQRRTDRPTGYLISLTFHLKKSILNKQRDSSKDRGEGIQIWRVALNRLKTQYWTADKGAVTQYGCWEGRGANSSPSQ